MYIFIVITQCYNVFIAALHTWYILNLAQGHKIVCKLLKSWLCAKFVLSAIPFTENKLCNICEYTFICYYHRYCCPFLKNLKFCYCMLMFVNISSALLPYDKKNIIIIFEWFQCKILLVKLL